MTTTVLLAADYGIDRNKVLIIKYAGTIDTFDVKVQKRRDRNVHLIPNIRFDHSISSNTYIIDASGFDSFPPGVKDPKSDATRCIIEGITGASATILPFSHGSLTEIQKISVITHIKSVPSIIS